MMTTDTTTLQGIWPAVLLETNAFGRVDLDAVSAVVEHFAAAGVHGLYTGDTASEFYAFEFDEWSDLAVHFREVTRRFKMPAAIGCTWTNQAGALRRIERARELGFDNIHLSQPYWVRLNDAAQKQFWRAVAKSADDLPIIVYAGSQGQFPLDGYSLRGLREICPAIAGTKQTGFDAVATNSLLTLCPLMAHFVHEQVLTCWMPLGAAGCMSNLAGLSASFTLSWFEKIQAGHWEEAFEIQSRVNTFYEKGGVPIRKAGYMLDKALAELGGCPGATRRMREPYAAVPDDLYQALAVAARRYLPECF